MNETLIYADGQQICYLRKEGKSEQAIILKNPKITHLCFIPPSCEVDQRVWGFKCGIEPIPIPLSPAKVNAELVCKPEDFIMEVSDNGGMMKHLTLGMFKNISVSQMFRIINKKLNERSGGK